MLKAALIGNLGRDAELRFSNDGQPLLSFSVASNSRVKDAGGAWQDRTEWVRCTLFGPRAEKLVEHLTRGQRLYVDGRLEARPWTDQQGAPRAGLSLVVANVEFAGSRQAEGDAPHGGGAPDERRQDRQTAADSEPAAGFDDELPY